MQNRVELLVIAKEGCTPLVRQGKCRTDRIGYKLYKGQSRAYETRPHINVSIKKISIGEKQRDIVLIQAAKGFHIHH